MATMDKCHLSKCHQVKCYKDKCLDTIYFIIFYWTKELAPYFIWKPHFEVSWFFLQNSTVTWTNVTGTKMSPGQMFQWQISRHIIHYSTLLGLKISKLAYLTVPFWSWVIFGKNQMSPEQISPGQMSPGQMLQGQISRHIILYNTLLG